MSLLSWWHFMHSDFVTMRILCFSGEWHLAHSIPTSLTCRACGKETSISLKNTLSVGMTRAWQRVAQYADGEARIAGLAGAPPAPAILNAAVTCSCPTRRIFRAYSMLCAARPEEVEVRLGVRDERARLGHLPVRRLPAPHRRLPGGDDLLHLRYQVP